MSMICPEPVVRSWRGWASFVLALLVTVGAMVPLAAPAAVTERPRPPPIAAPDRPRVPPLWLPLAGAVVRGFDARAGPFGPGHRGIDIAASAGEVVRAPAAGKVVFAGQVAGTTWVSVRVAPGVVATIGPLQGEPVTEGQVRRGTPVGRVAPGHGPGRAPEHGLGRSPGHDQGQARGRVPGPVGGAVTLHLSLRVDGEYLDPLAYLVDRPRPRLVPLPAPGKLPGA